MEWHSCNSDFNSHNEWFDMFRTILYYPRYKGVLFIGLVVLHI